MTAYQDQQIKYYLDLHKAELQRLLNIYNNWFIKKD